MSNRSGWQKTLESAMLEIDRQPLFKKVTMEISLMNIFEMGIDCGLLLAEKERSQEEWADAFNGAMVSPKYCMPTAPLERRQLHGEGWHNAKHTSFQNFLKIAETVQKNDEFIFITI